MKVVLIDDEQHALDSLERKLNSIGQIDICGSFLFPSEGKAYILMNDVDVVFLDIQLPEINGLELAEEIQNSKPHITIVFVTAFDKYAVQAFELHALDYLVKPFNKERLEKTVSRIQGYLESKKAISYSTLIQVNMFKQLSIESQQYKKQFFNWRTLRAQELFLYLLQNRGQFIQKSRLIELLWEDAEPSKVFPLLYTTVYQVRKVLKPYHNHIKIISKNNAYMLELKEVKIDVVEWEKQLNEMEVIHSGNIERYERLMEKSVAPYLQDYDYIWIEAERQRIEKRWLETALQIASFFQQHGDKQKAINWYKIICHRHPNAEQAYLELMKIYASEGQTVLVYQEYERLRKEVIEGLNVSLGEETVNWFYQWQQSASNNSNEINI